MFLNKQQVLSIILVVRQHETNKCMMIITIFVENIDTMRLWFHTSKHTESKCPRLNVWWTGEREQSIYMRPSQVFTYCVLTYTVPYVGSSVLHTAAVLAQHNLKPPGCTLTISGPYNLCYCCCNWAVTTNNGPDVALHVCVCYMGHDRNI